MKSDYSFKRFPKTRIATFDTFAMGLLKHHVSALLEFDVTENRKRLHDLRRKGINISFNAWLIKVISNVLDMHPEASAYLYNKKKLILFNDINISIMVEKKIGNNRVPIAMVIERTNEKSAQEITAEIENARSQELTGNDFVINSKPTFFERLYFHLPGFLRRTIWRIMLGNPRIAYNRMGNAIITSVGMMGRINGWFIHKSIHPVSFGIGSIIKKPVVIENEIKIREILNMTVLVDHDIIDGTPMVRFLNDMTRQIEKEFITFT